MDWRPRAETKKARRTAITLRFMRGRSLEAIEAPVGSNEAGSEGGDCS